MKPGAVAVPRLRAAAATRLRLPLYRNGYALVASSALTSVLGIVYWLLAARLYSAQAVGICAAVISAMTLLANVAQLNLKSTLNRFLPTSGAASAGLILRAYGLALALAGLAAGAFLAGIEIWAPELAFLAARPDLAIFFVVATIAWTIFILQDSVLAGLRRAGLVPAENLVFSAGKIVLLVALAGAAPMLGIYLAWSAPMLALIMPVNLLVFWRIVPAHVRATRGRERPAPLRTMASYLAADFAGYAIWSATVGILPLAVLHVAGAEATSHYYVAWAIAYGLYLIPSGMGQSLLTEAALDPRERRVHARRALAECAVLVACAAGLVAAAAPLLLGLLGGAYADDATWTLRLLALSAIPYAVTCVHVNLARAEGRMRVVVATYAALCAIVLAVGLPLLGLIGIDGLAIGWLAGQAAVAAAVAAAPTVRAGVQRARPLVRLVAPVVSQLERDGERWGDHSRQPGGGEVTIVAVGPAPGQPAAMIKRARTATADAAVHRAQRALAALAARPGLARWRVIAPRPLAAGTLRGRAFVAESVLPGSPADAALLAGHEVESFLGETTTAIGALHAATARAVTVDDALLAAWVDAPLARLTGVSRHREEALCCLRDELRGALAGRRVQTAFVHGDLWPGNVLIAADGTVSGIIDWEAAQECGLPAIDRAHLLITTRALVQRRELGAVVVDLLAAPTGSHAAARHALSMRTTVLLAWLHHVAGNLAKADRYARRRRWLRRNVHPVLSAVAAAHGVDDRRSAWLTRARSAELAPVLAIVTGIGLCLASVLVTDPRAMTDTGLVSVLAPAYTGGLLALTAGYAIATSVPRPRPVVLWGLLGALVLALHATPPLVYGTLRYSWAWKHVGIVDYIQRHGGVDPATDQLPVYHNWPGFFGLDTLLTELAGLPDAIGQAIWAPVAFNLLGLGALVFALSALASDRRAVWLAAWLYVVASWVGQDYFAPQALAFVLYLLLIGVTARWLRGGVRPGPLVAAGALVAAIAVTHPLTAVMSVLGLGALVLTGVCRVRWLPLAAGAIVAFWDLTFAAPFVSRSFAAVLESVRAPWATAETGLTATSRLSEGQLLVAQAGRGLVVALALLALCGVVRLLRGGRLRAALPAIALAVAPFGLLAAGDYDGEMIFRIYLFALPFAALLAGHAFGPLPSRRNALALGAVAGVLLTAFLFAHYGKDGQYHFTPDEVAAAQELYERAPAGSLLIEGTRNYPGQFRRYEEFRYVALDREPPSSHHRFVADPVGVFSDWMEDRRYPAAYLIITRSQKAEVAQLGVLPTDALSTIEGRLLASPRFRTIYRTRDAVVFALAPGERR